MFDPLAYDAARVRNRDLERVANRPDRLMGEELRLSARTRRQRRRRHRQTGTPPAAWFLLAR